MLGVARTKLPGVALHCDDMGSFRLGRRFDAVTCLFSSIGYLASIDALNAAIVNMASHLADDGVLVVEPWHHHNMWPADHRYQELVLTDTGAVERLLNVSVIDDVSILTMKYTVASNDRTTTFTEEHRLRLFSAEDYRCAMRTAGLAVKHDPVGLSGRGLFIGHRGDERRRGHG